MQLFPERRLVHVPAVRVGELHLSFDGALAIVLGRHEAYIGVRRVGAGGAVRALETVESASSMPRRSRSSRKPSSAYFRDELDG